MTDFIDSVAWFTRENFDAHRQLDPSGLHATFDEWLQNAERMMEQLKAKGVTVIPVVIEPEELAAWCALTDRKIDSRSRSLFASFIRHKRSQN